MTKTILHYFGEILVVTIGIFIAFQLNNYSEAQKTKSREENSLKRIVSDLETERKWLKKDRNDFARSKEKLQSILYEGDRKNLDSLYHYLGKEYVHYNFSVEYSTLKFSGQLFLISNDSVRSSLVKYYELSYAYSEKIAERHKDFVEEDLLEYTSDALHLDRALLYDPLKVEEALKDQELIERIEIQVMWYEIVLTAIKLELLNDLIDVINNEIGTNTNKQ